MSAEEKKPLQFASADERIAWDRFVAAGVAHHGFMASCSSYADAIILERRKREPNGLCNLSTDDTDVDGASIAHNLDCIGHGICDLVEAIHELRRSQS